MVQLEGRMFATPLCSATSRHRPDIWWGFVVPVEQPLRPSKDETEDCLRGSCIAVGRSRPGEEFTLCMWDTLSTSCVTLDAVPKQLENERDGLDNSSHAGPVQWWVLTFILYHINMFLFIISCSIQKTTFSLTWPVILYPSLSCQGQYMQTHQKHLNYSASAQDHYFLFSIWKEPRVSPPACARGSALVKNSSCSGWMDDVWTKNVICSLSNICNSFKKMYCILIIKACLSLFTPYVK